jgi:glycosyltransferase involved in cell wall biosynthesis
MTVTAVLPVINETFSLKETVDIVLAGKPDAEVDFLIVTAPRTTAESRRVIAELQRDHPNIVHTHEQTLPYLGGALREAFDVAGGEYTLLMASDLETDPHKVNDLIAEARKGYDIVATSRWLDPANFRGYNPLKLVLNRIFQIFFRLLYRTKLTDLTFGYRIYRTEILRKIKWEELRHPFLFECLIKPLRLGYSAIEIPCPWAPRKEGESQNTFLRNFVYFRIGLKVLLTRRKALLRN